MKVEVICKSIYEEIVKREFIGEVHSVFNNSFNILDNNNLFYTFINSNKSMSPYCIRIDEDKSFLELGVNQKMEVRILQKKFIIKDLNTEIEFDKTKFWDKKPNLIFEISSINSVYLKLKYIGKFISQKGKRTGIFNLNTSLLGRVEGIEFDLSEDITLSLADEFIKERFRSFIDSYIDEDTPNIYKKSKRIIGFGVGLTPSMDDFLSGLMISRVYYSYYLNLDMSNALKINKSIVNDIENKTTLVSENMLKFASNGEVNDDIRNLMTNILGNDSINSLKAKLEKIINFGETSGTDILLGIYTGSYIMLGLH